MRNFGTLRLDSDFGCGKPFPVWVEAQLAASAHMRAGTQWEDAAFGDLLRAIALVHSKGWVHRDVKCGNTLLSLFVATASHSGPASEDAREGLLLEPHWEPQQATAEYFGSSDDGGSSSSRRPIAKRVEARLCDFGFALESQDPGHRMIDFLDCLTWLQFWKTQRRRLFGCTVSEVAVRVRVRLQAAGVRAVSTKASGQRRMLRQG